MILTKVEQKMASRWPHNTTIERCRNKTNSSKLKGNALDMQTPHLENKNPSAAVHVDAPRHLE